jgi:nucleoside-diphosphate-sugar epimerase
VYRMKVFITGGSGYIGVATIAALTREGHAVEALVRSDSSAAKLNGATPVRGALTDLDVLREAAGRADAVIHLAADYSADAVQVERAATAAMLEGVGDGPFVFTGGVWVYGDTDGVADESAQLNPPAIVAWREASEQAVMESGGHPVLVMPGLVYGDRAGLIESFFAGKPAIKYIGDGANHWPLVDRLDIAELYVRALGAPAGARYLGVGATTPTLKQVAEALAISAGRAGETESISLDAAREAMGPIAEAFALDQRFTSKKARSELGWAPDFDDPLGELSRPG